jgi:hypothetical protein
MIPTTDEGYNCDTLQHTKILFVGSCDLDGPIDDTNKSWARLLHSELIQNTDPTPYIALAKMTAGFMSMPRRILTYCEKFGPPEQIYAVVPRPVSIEIPISNGKIVSVSNREGLVHWLQTHNKLTESDYTLLMAASVFAQSQMQNFNYQVYQFEQSAAFIKVICKLYDIQFNWTINLSSSAIPYYSKYLLTCLNSSQFMKDTFKGVALAADFSFDGSMGNKSQLQIYNLFKSTTDSCVYDEIGINYVLQQNLATTVRLTTRSQQAL